MTLLRTADPTPGASSRADHSDRARPAGGPVPRIRRLVRGRPEDPAWARPALWGLLALTAALYLWDLSASGWANSFYSAAAQAGSQSWKAFFYGSSDAANSITVDKPPLSLWPMALSVRIFGLSSWSLLVPQALMGVATVAVLHATVRRWFSAGAALLAGLALALTPVAALMFRFNNPDALLVLLMTVAASTSLRAVESSRLRWFVATGALVGLGFLTKQLQVLLVVPGFALAHLVCGGTTVLRRVRDLAVAAVAMVVAAGWWIAVVELVPAAMRPYIGGSQGNSIIELTLGYNGLGRITGDEVGSVGGGGPQGGGMWGSTGITRMVDGVIGGQIAWLLPAALLFGVAGFVVLGRAGRTDLRRAQLIVWSGWLVVTGLVFSFMGGIFHEYYTVALAPAIAALVGIGAALLWERRERPAARAALAAGTLLTAWWAVVLLGRAPSWNPWLGDVVAVAGVVAAAGLALGGVARRVLGEAAGTRVLHGAAVLAVAAGLAGPAAWTLQTVATPHSGSIVTAGPAVSGSGPGAGPGGRMGGGFPGAFPGGPGAFPGGGTQGDAAPTGGPPTGGPPQGGLPQGGLPDGGPMTGPMAGGPMMGGGPGPGGGGLLSGTTPGDEVVELLVQDAEDHTWVAATVGSNNASGYQLATERPVMAIGGFNGSDPSPTLEEFRQHVRDGRIHWFIAGGVGMGGSRGGSDEAQRIAAWVEEHFTATTVDGVTLYDLTRG